MIEQVTLIKNISARSAPRTEATLQADIRHLLLTAQLGLEDDDLQDIVLESPVGDRRRIDIEVGSCVIEVKKDLRKGTVASEAIEQLSGYVSAREDATGCRYTGILTDGAEWQCLQVVGGIPQVVSKHLVNTSRPNVDALLVWLEGVLATAKDVPPTPSEISRRLGAASSSYELDRASLMTLFKNHSRHPAVWMKRKLWAKLLTTALGAQFQDDDELFVEHTMLVNSAEIIAHAILGLDIRNIQPASLVSGNKFAEHEIYGVVEADFFDWVVHVPEGEAFIRELARRLSRFNWGEVQHDVLKVLYQSVISAETRKRLGEYYTPDWLAERLVNELIDKPLKQQVLDPACGSGTFLFHAVRRYLTAAEKAKSPLNETLEGLTKHVIGMDLHPVAVTLARVTYLLAIGRDRITDPARGVIQVPVYLGDSLQWKHEDENLWSKGHLVVKTDDQKGLFDQDLRFPDELLDAPGVFDGLVKELADKACQRTKGSKIPSLKSLFQRHAIPDSAHPTLEETFVTMCRLHDDGRDHIWGYYIRNLARPVWLSRKDNRVDILIGNPPWLAYRHMTEEMQETFRKMSNERKLWHGADVAPHQDLSGLFIARAVELYLKNGGRFAMVVPNAAIDRGHFKGFRSGVYPLTSVSEPVYVKFDTPWDLRRIRPHFFPRGAGVLFGERTLAKSLFPTSVMNWSGKLVAENGSWDEVKDILESVLDTIAYSPSDSPYRKVFTQGAIMSPRMIFVVQQQSAGPLGLREGKVAVASHRGANEKKPWKELPDMDGVVETEFVRPLYSSEGLVPYRLLEPRRAIIPIDGKNLFDGDDERMGLYPGLADWWAKGAALWEKHRTKKCRLSLLQQLDYRGKMSKQLTPTRERVVYTASGMHLAAARLSDKRAVINNSLYWANVASVSEARYLCAILNSAKMTELVRPFMSYGKDERHFDLFVWRVSIPNFNKQDKIHIELVELAQKLENEIDTITIDDKIHFAAGRRRIREHIESSNAGHRIEEIVTEMLD